MEKITNQNNKLRSDSIRTRIEILGVLVDNITLPQAVRQTIEWVQQRREQPEASQHWIATANPEYVMAARRDATFRALLNSADLVTPDGAGLILAGHWLGTPFQGRVTGVALCEELFRASVQYGLRLFLLGAGPGVAEEAAARLQEEYPGIKIVGTWGGEAGPEGDFEALERIRQAGPEVIMVAYGMLKQDWWVARNLQGSGATIAIGVGGVLDYKAGRVPLAPARLRKLGLEWLYRLYKEPWRWRRQLALPRFVGEVGWISLNRLVSRLSGK